VYGEQAWFSRVFSGLHGLSMWFNALILCGLDRHVDAAFLKSPTWILTCLFWTPKKTLFSPFSASGTPVPGKVHNLISHQRFSIFRNPQKNYWTFFIDWTHEIKICTKYSLYHTIMIISSIQTHPYLLRWSRYARGPFLWWVVGVWISRALPDPTFLVIWLVGTFALFLLFFFGIPSKFGW